MTFIVNSAEWNLNDLPETEVVSRLDKLLEFIAVSSERDEEVLVGDEFQSRPMLGDLTLWELDSDDCLISLPKEIFQELAAWLMKDPGYANEAAWPEGLEDVDIAIDSGIAEANVDLAWVHHSVRARKCVACYSVNLSGSVPTSSSFGSVPVHFVKNEEDRVNFWRNGINVCGDNLSSLLQYGKHAFPNLFFVGDVLNDFDKLGGGYLASRVQVNLALQVLDDYACWAFSCPIDVSSPEKSFQIKEEARPTNQIVIRRFRNLGLDVAPEKPNVWNDRVCREAREVLIGGRSHYCEWHVKLEGHRNRIHIHAPTEQTTHKPAIAIVHEHLPLP